MMMTDTIYRQWNGHTKIPKDIQELEQYLYIGILVIHILLIVMQKVL